MIVIAESKTMHLAPATFPCDVKGKGPRIQQPGMQLCAIPGIRTGLENTKDYFELILTTAKRAKICQMMPKALRNKAHHKSALLVVWHTMPMHHHVPELL